MPISSLPLDATPDEPFPGQGTAGYDAHPHDRLTPPPRHAISPPPQRRGRGAPVSPVVAWLRGPAQILLAHRGVICGQSIRHSGGYAAVLRVSDRIPTLYEQSIVCHGDNVRSPVFTRLMRTREPQYFHFHLHAGTTEFEWESSFRAAGWADVLCLCHEEGTGPDSLLTWAAFYDLRRPPLPQDQPAHRQLMLELHRRLVRRRQAGRASEMHLLDAHGERIMLTRIQASLMSEVLRGLTNKEIGRILEKSDQTVKRQLMQLMRRAGVRNRMELAARCRVE